MRRVTSGTILADNSVRSLLKTLTSRASRDSFVVRPPGYSSSAGSTCPLNGSESVDLTLSLEPWKSLP
jgi:hypothetical protein